MIDCGMKNAILHTKLQRAHVAPDIVPRDRLLPSLEEGRHRPLTLITAPTGYGKSTLASRWGRACGLPCAWVSLDGEDNDPHSFLAYLLAAIRELFPEHPLGTESLLDAGQLPSPGALARDLLNDLQGIKGPFILVLDDYHHIQSPMIHGLISELMAHPSQSLRLMLLTRTEPPLALAGMRARGLLAEIRVADLRLTPHESSAFMEQMLKAPVDEATAATLDSEGT